MTTADIIVVEDNDTMRFGIIETLKRDGILVRAFDNGIDAVKEFQSAPSQIAVVDLKMEPMDGIEVLKRFKEINPSLEILMISAFGTIDIAVKAMQFGAADFLSKPFSPDELRIRVRNLINKYNERLKLERLIDQNRYLNEELNSGFENIIGTSQVIKKIFSIIDHIADKDSTVLIHGESGTGKELIARAIHNKSGRSENPFIKINCGSLNDNLLESELFGHEKGAFTGAIKQKRGRFELADKGTLFLDEAGDISPAMQVKLLRVLQEGEFERVGGEKTLSTNVRVLAASNKDLQLLVKENKFREDLYYRLSVIPIHIPALRERKEDIPLLIDHFLKKLCERNKRRKTIDDDGIRILQEYSWPGNIRELENLVERLYVISDTDTIDPMLIGMHINKASFTSNGFSNMPLEDAMYSFERNLIIQAMKKADGVKNRAAKILGISTSVLYYKLEKFGLL